MMAILHPAFDESCSPATRLHPVNEKDIQKICKANLVKSHKKVSPTTLYCSCKSLFNNAPSESEAKDCDCGKVGKFDNVMLHEDDN